MSLNGSYHELGVLIGKQNDFRDGACYKALKPAPTV
jgi:hypothetical protein